MQTAATGKEGWETDRVKWTGSPQAVGHMMRSHMFWKTHWRRTVVTNEVLCPRHPDLHQCPQLQDRPSCDCLMLLRLSPRVGGPHAPAEDCEAGRGQLAGNMEAGLRPTGQAASGWPLPSFSPTTSALLKRALLSFFLSFLIPKHQILSVKA